MIDGAAVLTAMVHQLRAMDRWGPERGTNVLDGGAPYYSVYMTADDQYVTVGAMEPQFYRELLEGLGLADDASIAGAARRQDAVARVEAALRKHLRRAYPGRVGGSVRRQGCVRHAGVLR